MQYVSENHSKYLLMVHLIFVVKYRRNSLGKNVHFGQMGIFHIALEMYQKKQLKKYIQNQG